MIYYNNPIEKHIVTSVARILALAGDPLEGKDRFEQEIRAQEMLTSEAGRAELIHKIQNVLKKIPEKAKLEGILTRTHIKNTMKLVELTTENLPVAEHEINPVNYFTGDHGKQALKRLKMYKNTNMSYHDFELYGQETLQAQLRAFPDMEKATVEVIKLAKQDVEDETIKSNYMGAKPWIYYPMLPIVILRTNSDD